MSTSAEGKTEHVIHSDGGRAFPLHIDGSGQFEQSWNQGMSVRTWITGQAIAGLCATEGWGTNMAEAVAKNAVMIADATIERLGL